MSRPLFVNFHLTVIRNSLEDDKSYPRGTLFLSFFNSVAVDCLCLGKSIYFRVRFTSLSFPQAPRPSDVHPEKPRFSSPEMNGILPGCFYFFFTFFLFLFLFCFHQSHLKLFFLFFLFFVILFSFFFLFV